ncbi:MAG: thiamine pyrophosphate-dependent enzyme [bacterium]|nr:thiamine pyrophosphate-dependent enzyme [bacterium]
MSQMTAPLSENKRKFYQVGSFAVGNRLVPLELLSFQSDADRPNALTSGHRACQGCGEALGARYVVDAALAAADGKLLAVNATGCLEVFSTPYPETSWQLPWLHSLFGNAPAVASGVAAALKARGDTTTRVLAQGGDGGTVDIGFGCLSGMFERNDDVLYVCYDNEAYMNTGVQRSGATPPAARTATTQAVGDQPGNVFGQGKDVPRIAMAHDIPYVATATIADLRDLEYKVTKAMGMRGARYLHVLVPCPLGWGTVSGETVQIARLATQCGLFPVYEAEYGVITASAKIRQRVSVEDYLKPQRRFAHLFKPRRQDVIDQLQAMADRNIARYDLLVGDDDGDPLPRTQAGQYAVPSGPTGETPEGSDTGAASAMASATGQPDLSKARPFEEAAHLDLGPGGTARAVPTGPPADPAVVAEPEGGGDAVDQGGAVVDAIEGNEQ